MLTERERGEGGKKSTHERTDATHVSLHQMLVAVLKAFWTRFADIVKQKINLYSCQKELCTEWFPMGSGRNAINTNMIGAV